MTDTRRRSATGAGTAAGWAADGRAAEAPPGRAAPHSPQKRAAGPSGDPQEAQLALSLVPHCSQNFKPGGLLLPQFEQTAIEESSPGEAGTK
jgi:hypothetical protein